MSDIAERERHYRNKFNFRFVDAGVGGLAGGGLSLATMAPGKRRRELLPIAGSPLVYSVINDVAREWVSWLRLAGVRAADLKSLVLRANQKGECMMGLFVRRPLQLVDLPLADRRLRGYRVFLSEPADSDVSTPDQILYAAGDDFLEEKLLGQTFRYGLLSFFQVNVPVFEDVLRDMQLLLPETGPVVDFYGGVGAIGLSITGSAAPLTIIESGKSEVEYARHNSAALGRKQVQVVETAADQALAYIQSDATIIVDPPRRGLDLPFIKALQTVKPQRLIYLSCNPKTQARDVAALRAHYSILFQKEYDFFPGTEHVESLIVLERL